MIQNLDYENLVDFLVYNSGGKFETPEGILTGAQMLEKLWLEYAPKPGVELKKLSPLDNARKRLCTEKRVKLIDDGDVWDVALCDESGELINMGIRLA